jgi:hypothetical protein
MKRYSLKWEEIDGTVGRLGEREDFRNRGFFNTHEEAAEAKIDMLILHPDRTVTIQKFSDEY